MPHDSHTPHSALETAGLEKRRERQAKRFRRTAEHACETVRFHRERFERSGLAPGDIEGMDDLVSLPLTTKEDLLDRYPDGLVATPREDVVRVHASSGTGGKPTVVCYTESDIEVWNEVVARLYAGGGMTADDTYQVSLGYGLFTGGFGFHQGAEEIGARIVPMSGGNTERQLQMIQNLESDSMGLVTSYALYMAETAEEMGLDPTELPVSTIFVGGEMTTEAMIDRIATRWDADVYSNYGLSEIVGPGVAAQCHARSDSMHVQEDHFYPEVIDPETGGVLDEGKEGELVLTTLTKEALPLFRYRTGDITSLHYGECDCGRTTVRMAHVTGRTDNMITIRGTNVFVSQIETVAYDVEDLSEQYRVDVSREGTMDRLTITVEHDPEYDGDPEDLEDRLAENLSVALQLIPDEVDVVEPGTIERTEVGKVKRLYDHRSFAEK